MLSSLSQKVFIVELSNIISLLESNKLVENTLFSVNVKQNLIIYKPLLNNDFFRLFDAVIIGI